MNSKTVASQTAINAIDLIQCGLEVNAECYAEENIPSCDEAVLELVREHGLKAILESLHDAAYGAAEVHEEADDVEDMSSFRCRMFGVKIDAAIKALR